MCVCVCVCVCACVCVCVCGVCGMWCVWHVVCVCDFMMCLIITANTVHQTVQNHTRTHKDIFSHHTAHLQMLPSPPSTAPVSSPAHAEQQTTSSSIAHPTKHPSTAVTTHAHTPHSTIPYMCIHTHTSFTRNVLHTSLLPSKYPIVLSLICVYRATTCHYYYLGSVEFFGGRILRISAVLY